jgi:hypothetical protein
MDDMRLVPASNEPARQPEIPRYANGLRNIRAGPSTSRQTSASWLNAIEGFFAKLTNRRLKRGVFRSVAELQAAIESFIAETDADPKPRLDGTPKPHPRCCQTRERKVRVDPLAQRSCSAAILVA